MLLFYEMFNDKVTFFLVIIFKTLMKLSKPIINYGLTELSRPRVTNMKNSRTAQKLDPAKVAMASG